MYRYSANLRGAIHTAYVTTTRSNPPTKHCMRMTVTVLLTFAAGCNNGSDRLAKIEKAQAQVKRIAESLDKRTTESGVYIRVKEDDVKENDPWGTPVKVVYSQGGVAEMLIVRSTGPDREFHTDDDVTAQAIAANLKGIGEGIRKNVEDTAASAAKGVVKGAVEGVKESVKESLPFKRNTKGADAEPKPEKTRQDVRPDADKRSD